MLVLGTRTTGCWWTKAQYSRSSTAINLNHTEYSNWAAKWLREWLHLTSSNMDVYAWQTKQCVWSECRTGTMTLKVDSCSSAADKCVYERLQPLSRCDNVWVSCHIQQDEIWQLSTTENKNIILQLVPWLDRHWKPVCTEPKDSGLTWAEIEVTQTPKGSLNIHWPLDHLSQFTSNCVYFTLLNINCLNRSPLEQRHYTCKPVW